MVKFGIFYRSPEEAGNKTGARIYYRREKEKTRKSGILRTEADQISLKQKIPPMEQSAVLSAAEAAEFGEFKRYRRETEISLTLKKLVLDASGRTSAE